MKNISIKIVLGYKDIFEENEFDLLQLLKGYDPEKIILLLSNINFRLFDNQSDLLILKNYFSKEPIRKEHVLILNAISKSQNIIFNERTNELILCLVFENYNFLKNNFNEKGLILDFLHVYLKLNETSHGDIQTDFSKVNEDYLQELIQILYLSKQYNFSRSTNITYELLKLKSLFHYYYEFFPNLLKEFFLKNNITDPNSWFAAVLVFISNRTQNDLNLFDLNNNTTIKKYLDNISINPLLNKKINIESLQRHPVLKMDNNYNILNWNYFFIGYYFTINFNLYQIFKKNIKEISFGDYRSDTGKEIGEKIMFRYVIKKLIRTKDSITNLNFDSKINGFPDCYLRIGNKIFVIEYKDYVVNGKFLENFDVENVLQELEDLFVIKGVGQLAKFINTLPNSKFDFDIKINKKFIEISEIEIIPIIIVSEEFFAIAPIENYLGKRFEKLICADLPFKRICNLTVLNIGEILHFLMDNNEDDYFKLIYKYSKNKKIRVAKKMFTEFPTFKYQKSKYYQGDILKEIMDEFKICD